MVISIKFGTATNTQKEISINVLKESLYILSLLFMITRCLTAEVF